MAVDLPTLREPQRPLEDRILDFLEAHPDQAFNAYDVYAALEGLSAEASAILALVSLSRNRPPPRFVECSETLDALVDQGRIAAAVYRGSKHFRARSA